MKIIKIFFTLLFLLPLLCLSGCSDDDDNSNPVEQLPPATQIGANTAGAYINGELLVPKNSLPDFGTPVSPGLKFIVGSHFGETEGDDFFSLVIANRRDSGGDYLYLYLPTLIAGENTYQIGESNGTFFDSSSTVPHIIILTSENKTYYSGTHSGSITITNFDYPNRIYSGEFELTLYNVEDQSDIIHVTEGRFDINGYTLNQ